MKELSVKKLLSNFSQRRNPWWNLDSPPSNEEIVAANPEGSAKGQDGVDYPFSISNDGLCPGPLCGVREWHVGRLAHMAAHIDDHRIAVVVEQAKCSKGNHNLADPEDICDDCHLYNGGHRLLAFDYLGEPSILVRAGRKGRDF